MPSAKIVTHEEFNKKRLEKEDYDKARSVRLSISLLDSDMALYNIRASDFKNILQYFLELDLILIHEFSNKIWHRIPEIEKWLMGDEIPQEPNRTAIVTAIDLMIQERYPKAELGL